ncbi:hypothetical protein CK203_038437 [Vitis vinifera]|uniref:DUF4283 domain-containing protein n=1 Tax=Vitis vinifera TaxID=29760 RepID=A0A438IRX9_VITVI|nr:hypothetical protein CK203_038437 [Vitis vinifera]
MPAKRGGRCWFAMDSKSFEISVEVYGERWVEACCRSDIVQGLVKGEGMEEGGLSWKVEQMRQKEKVFWEDGFCWLKSFASLVFCLGMSLGEMLLPMGQELGEKDIPSERKLMDRCLVGRWGQTPLSDPDMSALGSRYISALKRKPMVQGIEPALGQEAFRKIGDCCRGFVAVDENTANFKELQWGKLLVRYEGLEWPSSLQVVVGSLCYAFQLWWEVKPGLSEVVPVIKNEKGKEREVRDDGEGDSRAGFKIVREQMHGEPAKVAEPCKVGEGGCRKKAQPSSTMSETETEANRTTGGQFSAWGKSSCFGPRGNLSLGQQRESGWERELVVEG